MDEITAGDIVQHVASFGIDTYPPVDLAVERTRLNMFYEEASKRWPELYDELRVSSSDFRIAGKLAGARGDKGRSATVDTFALRPRGPVFMFPLVLADPVNETGLEPDFLAKFAEVRELFFSAIPERKIMRLGLVRTAVLATGDTPCRGVLTSSTAFGNAELFGGNMLLVFRDDLCNVRLTLEPVAGTRTTQLPVGKQVREQVGFGLRVELDVNNREVRPSKKPIYRMCWCGRLVYGRTKHYNTSTTGGHRDRL